MKVRPKKYRKLDRGVPSEYEIGVPVRIIKPGLITCMPVPARGVITSIDIDAIQSGAENELAGR